MRKLRTGPKWPVRILYVLAASLLAAPISVMPAAAKSQSASTSLKVDEVSEFYRSRQARLLWFDRDAGQADALLQLLGSAELDGLKPDSYGLPFLTKAVNSARSGGRGAKRRAEILLSHAFVAYVSDLHLPANTGTIYVDRDLKPTPPRPSAILEAAASSPSLQRHVAEMRWMHPIYAELRRALASGDYRPDRRDLIRVNMERARELPPGGQRYVLVNPAAQRLFMYEGRQAVDSMRVVVGKPVYPTPMMAAYIRFASLNPYWYVPADLAAERIAPNVLKQGLSYLHRQGYQVVSDFVDNPAIFDPSLINWQDVAEQKTRVLIRQLPGPHNSMGRIKFMFPNGQGVYLHDNPERELFEQAARLYSGGCVRLEDAWRLSRWLFGRDLTWQGAGPEEKVRLETPVPVYITYLTAVPEGAQITFLDDVYERDGTRMAELGGSGGRLTAD